MEMKDFIMHCLGVSNNACEKFSEILWDLGVDIDEANIYDVLSSIDDFSSFGNCLVRDMICRIISLSCDKYPILEEDNFDYYVNGSDCHLYYNGNSICSIKDIEEIAEDLEENE